MAAWEGGGQEEQVARTICLMRLSHSGCWGLAPRGSGELVSGSPATLEQGYSILWAPSLAWRTSPGPLSPSSVP